MPVWTKFYDIWTQISNIPKPRSEEQATKTHGSFCFQMYAVAAPVAKNAEQMGVTFAQQLCNSPFGKGSVQIQGRPDLRELAPATP